MKPQVRHIVQSKAFSRTLFIVGAIFIILTYFIAITPQAFLKYSYFGIFIFNALSSGLLLFPILVGKFNIVLVILVSALGNAVNTSISYLVGYTSTHMFSKNPLIIKAKHWIERFGLIMVYVLAIIPLPIDVNGLLSGYVGIPYKKYLFVNFLGKITIFSLVAYGVISAQQFLNN